MGIPGRIIYGGSFNPLHTGHMRLALECVSWPHLPKSLEFLPCAIPPHKERTGLLPFELRCAMIRKTILKFPYFSCNAMEGERAGPSYTYVTMEKLRNAKDGPLYFLLGSQDFEMLAEWWRGLELPDLCALVVLPRQEYSKRNFITQVKKFWGEPQSVDNLENDCTKEQCVTAHLQSGGKIVLLPAPPLAISASRIRNLWLCGRNIDYLAPGPVVDILNANEQAVRACWQETGKKCSM